MLALILPSDIVSCEFVFGTELSEVLLLLKNLFTNSFWTWFSLDTSWLSDVRVRTGESRFTCDETLTIWVVMALFEIYMVSSAVVIMSYRI